MYDCGAFLLKEGCSLPSLDHTMLDNCWLVSNVLFWGKALESIDSNYGNSNLHEMFQSGQGLAQKRP